MALWPFCSSLVILSAAAGEKQEKHGKVSHAAVPLP
jgi:hypothetical protein